MQSSDGNYIHRGVVGLEFNTKTSKYPNSCDNYLINYSCLINNWVLTATNKNRFLALLFHVWPFLPSSAQHK
ncbi:Uncharacterized protein TCM_006999 [Theobroma cacao]|uniref:Uncharacterized protein n=1 Tax=Theobroma cacao TaxID=3641 RepID=A0A061DZL5_THECC|nr:Uncharacterized protein TCM_006999 [Theobroma cacao]